MSLNLLHFFKLLKFYLAEIFHDYNILRIYNFDLMTHVYKSFNYIAMANPIYNNYSNDKLRFYAFLNLRFG